MKRFYDEGLWEEYVKKYPDKFLDEKLTHVSQQKNIQSGRIDLVFKDINNKFVIVELQQNALDRTHFAKTLEYKADLEEEYKQDKIRIILLCNAIEERRHKYIEMHKQRYDEDILVKIIPIEKVKKIIKNIDPKIIFVPSRDKLPENIKFKNWQRKWELDSHNRDLERLKKKYSLEIGEIKRDLLMHIIDPNKSFNEIRKHYTDIIYDISSERHDGQYGIKFTTTTECRDWIDKLRDLILKEAWKKIKFWQGPLPEGYMWAYKERRAPCPLCGAVADSWYYVEEAGYKLDDGLLMHLDGTGNTRECRIYKHLIKEVETKNSELWELERVKEEDKKNERKENETLFKISYHEKGKLFDEDSWSYEPAKNLIDINILADVEKRLFSMNFKKNNKGREVSYTLENEKYIIYADPRPLTKIDFRVYKKPIQKKDNKYGEDFYILDKWKDLNRILNNRINKHLNNN